MDISRRRLLQAGPIAAATSALAALLARAEKPGRSTATAPAGPVDLGDWAAVRRQFDLAPEFIHLGLFFLASHPRPVRDAIEGFRRELDRNPLLTVEQHLPDPRHPGAVSSTATAIARYTGLPADEIALTSNTTTGLALAWQGLPLKPGDDVLTTNHDHYSQHESIRLATERAGASWRRIPLFDSFSSISADQIVERIRRAVKPNTRAVGVTWVHSSSGLKLPVRRIADALAAINAGRAEVDRVLLVVDGVHGLGVEDPRLGALGADVFSAGLHKWIFAPRGTGFLWARAAVWARMRPVIPSFSSSELFGAWLEDRAPRAPAKAAMFSPGGFQSYEHHWAVPAAIEFHERMGPARVTERIHALNTQMKEGLARMPNVVTYTPRSPEMSAGMTCFDLKGMKADAVVARMMEKKILISATPYRDSYARVAFGVMNTPAEVDAALAALRALA